MRVSKAKTGWIGSDGVFSSTFQRGMKIALTDSRIGVLGHEEGEMSVLNDGLPQRTAFVLKDVEILETPVALEIIANLPEFEEIEILDLNVNEGRLELHGVFDLGENASPRFRSCTFGAFSKVFRLDENVRSDRIDCKVEDGLLCIAIPKDLNGKFKDRSSNPTRDAFHGPAG